MTASPFAPLFILLLPAPVNLRNVCIFSISEKKTFRSRETNQRTMRKCVCVCVAVTFMKRRNSLRLWIWCVTSSENTEGSSPNTHASTPLPHNFPLTEQIYERRRKSECKFETNTAGPALQHHCQSSQTDFHFHLTSLTRDNLAAGHSDCSGLRLSFISFRDERR